MTVKGPSGHAVDVRVAEPEVLGKLNIGDLVELTTLQAVAVAVEKVPAT